jgi:dihydroorotate dehydrogenase (fumarate)
MDLKTRYLGFDLPHPFIPGASPLVNDLDMVRRLEDAGAAAIVMHSLFEEQIVREQMSAFLGNEAHVESFPEALSFLPRPDQFRLGPESYLEHVQRVKAAVKIPVIASLNGITLGGWLNHARLLEEAGADALELNVYQLATDPHETGHDIEETTIEMLRALKTSLKIPIAVKLSPFYTSFAHFAHRLDGAGADALVLFNRFYQPDIDVEDLSTVPSLKLSDRSELLLRLRWLAILSGGLRCDLASSGGVQNAVDAVKAVMAGAGVVQVVSALLRNGPDYLSVLRADLATGSSSTSTSRWDR